MSEVTAILSAIEQGDAQDAARLLPLVYDELRRRAAQRLAQETPGRLTLPSRGAGQVAFAPDGLSLRLGLMNMDTAEYGARVLDARPRRR